jgi:hypothetical protein
MAQIKIVSRLPDHFIRSLAVLFVRVALEADVGLSSMLVSHSMGDGL